MARLYWEDDGGQLSHTIAALMAIRDGEREREREQLVRDWAREARHETTSQQHHNTTTSKG